MVGNEVSTPSIGVVQGWVARALDHVEDLVEDADGMARTGVHSRLIGREALQVLEDVRKVAMRLPDADYERDCTVLPALLLGAHHVPGVTGGGAIVLRAAYELADAATRVLARFPQMHAADVTCLRDALSRYPGKDGVS